MTSPPPPPPSDFLSTNFTGWNAQRTVAYTRKFVAKLTGHPAFPEPWPTHVAALGTLSEKSNLLELADHESGSGDKLKIANRNFLNEDLKVDLRSAVKHVDMVARGNIVLIRSLDLNMREIPVKKKTPAPMGQAVLTATHGETCAFRCKVQKPPGTLYIELYINEGDAADETQWLKYGDSTTQIIKVTGRVPGKTYHLRARLVGRGGPGPFSPIITIISL